MSIMVGVKDQVCELSKITSLIRARVLTSLPVVVALGLNCLTAFKLRVDFEN